MSNGLRQDCSAAAAWKQVCAGAAVQDVEILKPGNRKSAVYRLRGGAPGGQHVIAKRCRAHTATMEEFVYREILPALDGGHLELYATAPDQQAGFSWLFVEDAGDVPFELHDERQRVLAARWLAGLHRCRIPEAARTVLPERGPEFHLQILAEAQATIGIGLGNPAFAPSERAILERIAAACRQLEARQEEWLRMCQSLPPVLVHGDLARKNVRMLAGRFIPFDWETSGIGFPAVDLAVVDTPTYWSETRSAWPGLELETLRRIAHLGRIFWCLVPIRGESASLAAQWVSGVMGKMSFYEAQISQSMTELGWTDLGREEPCR